jgi:hypothetical protein
MAACSPPAMCTTRPVSIPNCSTHFTPRPLSAASCRSTPPRKLRNQLSSTPIPYRDRCQLARRTPLVSKCASVPPIPAGVTMPNKSRAYFFFPPPIFPVVPLFGRETFRYEVLPDRMWRFEQKQGIGLGLNVSVNVCMTVIKMKSGGLFVYSPIAATKECFALINDLGAPVEYIVLPTTLFEHKVFAGPFQRKFPKAKLWVCPGQWSWPLNLPPTFFGIFPTGTASFLPPPSCYAVHEKEGGMRRGSRTVQWPPLLYTPFSNRRICLITSGYKP